MQELSAKKTRTNLLIFYYEFRKRLIRGLFVKKSHAGWDDKIECVRDKTHNNVFCKHGLSVDVDDVFFFKIDAYFGAAEVSDILGYFIGSAGCIFADKRGKSEQAL